MYARHRLDLDSSDLAFAATAGLRGDPPAPPTGTLRCLSVRSGFHLLLQALHLPPGTEVLFSALTHPDLPRLAAHHGLVPVPVDLDPDSLAPDLGRLQEAISERTGLVVVAHLFGGLVDLTGVARLAEPRGIPVVEDCAQAYTGQEYWGDARAAVSMFSFGLLKTATAFGGAVLRVRDGGLLQAMADLQDSWPVQAERAYAARVARAAAFAAGGQRLPYGLVVAAHAAARRDLDRTVNGAVRSLPAGSLEALVHGVEQRPCRSLLLTLERRLRGFDGKRLARRAAAGEGALAALPPGVRLAGGRMARRTHWLFPVIVSDPDALVVEARAAGFDAARAASNLHAVAAPAGRPGLAPRQAAAMLAGLVYLPMYPEIPEAERRRLVGEVVAGRRPARPPELAT